MATHSVTTWRTPLSIFGVEIRIHLSWLMMAALIAWSLAVQSLPAVLPHFGPVARGALAIATVLGLGLSVIFHEMAHTLAARSRGLRVRRISLFLLGGLAELEGEATRPGVEFAVALAGPLFSLVFSLVLVVASGVASLSGQTEAIAYCLAYLAVLNLVVALFNLTPAFPLDGGRVLRAGLWALLKDQRKATIWAVQTSDALALLAIGFGLVTAFRIDLPNGLWWVVIGIFLRASARSELRHLDDVRGAEAVLGPDVIAGPLQETFIGWTDAPTALGRLPRGL